MVSESAIFGIFGIKRWKFDGKCVIVNVSPEGNDAVFNATGLKSAGTRKENVA